MKYEKPIVMDLNARARHAAGQGPLACINGVTATGSGESCGAGNSADFTCLSGTSGYFSFSCLSGGSASTGDCLNGTAATGYCSGGSGQLGSPDPYGCSAGPTIV
jgi:hypothetical protein